MTDQPPTSEISPSLPSTLSCYLCGLGDLRVIRNRLRHGVTRNVLVCNNCGLNFLEPQNQDLRDYYEGDYRKMYSPVVGQKLTPKELFDINLPNQHVRVNRIKHLLRPDMDVLDVGCSAGFFLYAVRPYVGSCTGIEFNREDAAFVNDELGITTYSTPIEETDLEPGSFDLITAFHVLEHIEDPIALLASLRPYLKDDGYLYFEVPNADDALLSIYRNEAYADFWYREPHLFNFNPETLTRTMKQAGFTGEAFTIQRYSLLNHLNWELTRQPQSSFRVGTAAPELVTDESVKAELRDELNALMQRTNETYREILNRHGRGDAVVFIGQKNE